MLNRLFLPLALAFTLCVTPALAQNGSFPVTGTVRDQSGAPLPGATVSVEGTATGTVADATGQFSLTVPGEGAVLVAESLGFKSI
ncbi:MAG: carboxypeptidase-like regulatory domain-containing protein, partial [Bacteroidales bacterium]|nr:carboxypeptidase-like regulatory domain-containing protein [Bacteroidales bacterium]